MTTQLQNNTTIVTAFFDINREHRGDGRTTTEYLEWIKKTLQLNCNMFIVTEPKFKDFFEENRPQEYKYQTKIHIIEFQQSHYYQYYDQIKQIIEDPEYKSKIDYPNRVECILPEYNVIQYSKFHYLQMAIEQNPFDAKYFFWADAGISRFCLDVDLTKTYPSERCQQILNNIQDKFIIQKRYDLETYIINDKFIWRADNLLYGTMFGGSIQIIKEISKKIEHVFKYNMLANKNVNNEQLALAIVWKENPALFYTTENIYRSHLSLFKIFSL